MVARWGVLYNTTRVPQNKYCGRVFMRGGSTGHLFNQHYISSMFPLIDREHNEFLDEPVDVETDIAVQRESFGPKSLKENRRMSDNGVTNGLKINFIEAARTSAADAQGKTVRELSRLWRYAGGKKPMPNLDALAGGMVNGTTPQAMKMGK